MAMKQFVLLITTLFLSYQSSLAQSTPVNDAFTPVNDAFKPVAKPFKPVSKPFKPVAKPFKPVTDPYKQDANPYKQVDDPYKVVELSKEVEFTHAVELGRVVELSNPVNGWRTSVNLGHAVDLSKSVIDWSKVVELGNPVINWNKAVELGRSVDLSRPVELGQIIELSKIVELSRAVEKKNLANSNVVADNATISLPAGFTENINRGLQAFDYLKNEVGKSLQFFTGNFDETNKMWEDKYVQSYKDGHPNGFYLFETVASSLFTTKNAPTTLSALMLAPGLFEVEGIKIASSVNDGYAIKLINDGSKIVENEAATQLSVRDKLTNYLLNTTHDHGATKAQWFEQALGFTGDNSGELAKQLVFDANKAVKTEVTQYGTKYNIITSIKGANGQSADIITVWIKNNDDIVRLVTAYPER